MFEQLDEIEYGTDYVLIDTPHYALYDLRWLAYAAGAAVLALALAGVGVTWLAGKLRPW
jgi:hypothetical protein